MEYQFRKLFTNNSVLGGTVEFFAKNSPNYSKKSSEIFAWKIQFHKSSYRPRVSHKKRVFLDGNFI